MNETFNCTFELFEKSANVSSNKQLHECKILAVTKPGNATFRQVINKMSKGQ